MIVRLGSLCYKVFYTKELDTTSIESIYSMYLNNTYVCQVAK